MNNSIFLSGGRAGDAGPGLGPLGMVIDRHLSTANCHLGLGPLGM